MSVRAWQRRMFVDGAENFAHLLGQMRIDGETQKGLKYFAGESNLKGAVLDLGCGPGRFLGFFSSMARSVTGVDISLPFLDMAKRRKYGTAVSLVNADILAFLRKNREEFNAIFRLYTSLGYFSRREELEILRRSREHAAAGGVMIVDSFNGAFFKHNGPFDRLSRAETLLLHEHYRFDHKTDQIVCRWRFLEGDMPHYDDLSSVELKWDMIACTYHPSVVQEILFKLDSYDVDSIGSLVTSAGWKLQAICGDLSGSPVSRAGIPSERLVCVLTKP